jgi:uncharacterized protein HemX
VVGASGSNGDTTKSLQRVTWAGQYVVDFGRAWAGNHDPTTGVLQPLVKAPGVPVIVLLEWRGTMMRVMAAVGIVALLVGALAGYLMWGRPTQRVADELAAVRRQVAEETQRASEMQSKLADTEAQLKRLTEALKSEREVRQRHEQTVSEGRK